ncbi:hypothetical protein EDB83DRAFT_2531441 [Lactarius deliciosus]|nr:hypothetical protein EDB83DRAFT_2531441 [Lactarius deliciosus]
MSLCRELCSTRAPSTADGGNGETTPSVFNRRSGSLFAGSSTPTPAGSIRRRRDSDDFGYNLREDTVIARPAWTGPITPRTTKRLKISSETLACRYNIDPEPLQSFAESPTVLDMLLVQHARLLKVENSLNKVQRENYLESDEFKSSLQDRLLVALLSPSIPAYVTDVAARMMVVIREQWKLFKVPMAVFEDPDYYAQLETLVSVLLTACRSSIKQKIEGSFWDDGNTHHIGLLAQRLLSPKGVLISLDHWSRFAFLRSALRDFVKITGQKKPAGARRLLKMRPKHSPDLVGLRRSDLEALGARMSGGQSASDNNDDEIEADDDNEVIEITKKEYTTQQFWNYVDDYLAYIRTDLFKELSDPAALNRKITWFFSEALQVDLYNYQGGSKIPLRPSGDQLPIWQETLHNSTCWD